MGTLFVVSTPIGNLDDLTRRAESTLHRVSRVLAEDTRRTRILMNHIGAVTRVVSLHAHNEAARIPRVLEWLAAGEDLALVSDAGTPLLSDPGQRVVRASIDAGHEVVPIPGASAVLAALVASGLPAGAFAFLGFPARKGKDRARALARVGNAGESTILYEAPGRLSALLEDLVEVCGDARRVAVGREITKLHEEFFRGTLAAAVLHFRDRKVRGEVTLVVEPTCEQQDEEDASEGIELARTLLAAGQRPSEVARELSSRLGLPRNLAYSLVHDRGAEE